MASVLSLVFRGTDQKVWSSIACYRSIEKECRSCGFRSVPPVYPERYLRLLLLKNYTLENCWNLNFRNFIFKCTCGSENLKTRHKVEGTNDYMLLVIDRSPEQPNVKLRKLNRDGVYRIAGQHWRMLAFSEDITVEKEGEGHYRSHVDCSAASRHKGNWVCVDDNNVNQSTVNPSDVIVNIIVLKKIEV
ncbi:unnamed protein product [Caenorhabditis brenneri]